jgi:hypothetical protein
MIVAKESFSEVASLAAVVELLLHAGADKEARDNVSECSLHDSAQF